MGKYLALDIGGTKIEICTFGADYQLMSAATVPTTSLSLGSLDFIDDLKALVRQHLKTPVVRLGVSFNCAVDQGVIVASSILGGFDISYPLEKEFKAEFGVEVYLENDVNAQALAVARFGEGRGVHSFVLINLGTGLRLAYVHQGELLRGYRGSLGEFSSAAVYLTELGRSLTLGDVLSGGGIGYLHGLFSSERKSAKEIFAASGSGRREETTVKAFNSQLVQLLAAISRFYNPRKIILMGGVLKSAGRFLPQVLSLYREQVFAFQLAEVVVSELKHAACLGVVLDR